ncbi:MAG: hypothetical protein QOD56_1714 [Gammaproteobacteria bacterium]|nr:hypothetical protein [Gammaproteobacteria bacterium]
MTANIFLSIAAACVAVCALVIALIALQALGRWRARYESLESSFAALRRELEIVASISARTGRRVQRVEHEYSDVVDRVDVVESRGPAATGSGALDQAIEWARRGADSEKLTEQFGLSSGEAELVARLHGHGRKKSA